MCVIHRVIGQDRGFKCLWMGYGSRCQAHRFGSRTATLLGFSHSTVSCVYQEWSTTQRTSSQLDTTVWSIGVNIVQHLCGTLSTIYRVHARTNWGCSEGKMGCNSMLGRCSQCLVHSVYIHTLEQFNWSPVLSDLTGPSRAVQLVIVLSDLTGPSRAVQLVIVLSDLTGIFNWSI
jgi:hypothetical protein